MRCFSFFQKKQRNIKLVLLIAVFGFITGFLIISPSTKAATFDSDLLPDVTNSRSIGTLTGALKTWKNLFLTGVLSLGTATDAQETGVTTATGGFYFNTTGNNLKVYNGTTWQAVGGSKWTTSGSNIYYNTGNIGIGLATTPTAKLDVAGGVKLANDTATCDSTKAGTLRWTGINFSGCNGTTWVTYVTLPTPIEYLVVGGGGGSGYSSGQPGFGGGGGGAGGFRTNIVGATSGAGSAAEAALTAAPGTQYAVIVGNGGAGLVNGANSIFGSITSIGGGFGAPGVSSGTAGNGGSGGGPTVYFCTDHWCFWSGYGTAGQGAAGGAGQAGRNTGGGCISPCDTTVGGPGGGAASSDVNGTVGYAGIRQGSSDGTGLNSSITGSAIGYAGGGQGGGWDQSRTYYGSPAIWVQNGSGTSFGGGGANTTTGAGTAGAANKGGGGGSGNGAGNTSAGGSGVVIIVYPDTYPALTTISAGLTYSVSTTSRPGYRVYTFTAGTGTITI